MMTNTQTQTNVQTNIQAGTQASTLTETLLTETLLTETLLPELDHKQLKQVYSSLAAGTSVITMIDQQQVRMGFTATAVTCVSVEPPLVLVCVNNASRTIPVFQSGATFVINLLTSEQQSLGMQFASRDADKFANVNWSVSSTGGLHLGDTLASMECVPHEIYPAGDHHIVIGRVTDIRMGADDVQPLVFFRSHFMA